MAVIHDGQTLLGELERDDEAPPEGLKERLQLLIGHAFLYGIGDRDSAEDHYQAVLRSGAEASLRQIAEQGLQQCTLPVAPAEVGDEPLDSLDNDQASSPTVGTSGWQQAATAELPADVGISSPSDSSLGLQGESAETQGPDDSWQTSDQQAPAAEADALSWFNTAAPAQDSAAQPVMPWLENDAAAVPVTPEPVGSDQPQQAVDGAGEKQVAVPQLQEPAGGLLPSQQGEPWADPSDPPPQAQPMSFGMTPADAEEVGAEPLAADLETAPAWSPGGFATPEAIAADIAAVFQSESVGTLPDSVPGSVVPMGRVQEPQDSSGSLDAATFRSEVGDSSSASSEPISVEQRLVPDVVEEPELIELHPAVSQAGEELLLPIDDQQSAQLPSQAEFDGATAASAEPLLRSERDRGDVEQEAEDRAPQVRLTQPAEEPVPVAIATGSTPPVRSGGGPFSAPPEPVAEEDPELLMGLLKVEMG